MVDAHRHPAERCVLVHLAARSKMAETPSPHAVAER